MENIRSNRRISFNIAMSILMGCSQERDTTKNEEYQDAAVDRTGHGTASNLIEDGGTATRFIEDAGIENNAVSIDTCAGPYLRTESTTYLFAHSEEEDRLCQVNQGQLVLRRTLNDDEEQSESTGWIPVTFGLCSGWADSSMLRCPEAGERPTWNILPVPYHNQLLETDRNSWNPNSSCMATALTMILDYSGVEDDLNEVLVHAANIPPEEGGYDPNCQENPVCTSAGATVVVAEAYCTQVDAGQGWTQQDVVDAINGNKPVFALVTSNLVPGGFGHAMVLVGYLDNGARIVYHDPMKTGESAEYDGNFTVDWEILEASWAGPVDEGDPLQPEGHMYWGLTCTI